MRALSLSGEVQLAQALIRAPSPSGRESAAASVLFQALEQLGYQSAQDEAGNVIGVLRRGEGPTVMFNGHLDTVPVGDEANWPYPPLSAELAEGRLWGRGACDMKSALACMAFAGRDAFEAGLEGTLIVTGVVQEEVGGLGARYLAEHAHADLVIVGEPSNLRLMLGHRGRVEISVEIPGTMAHAARNDLGDNALYRAATLLLALQALELPRGGPLKGSSLTPTRLVSLPDSPNVVPGRAVLTIDYRNIPGDEPEAVLARLQALMPEATFRIPEEQARSESGAVERRFPRLAPAYLTPGENRFVNRARQVLKGVVTGAGQPFDEGLWWFCTDAPYLSAMGAPVIGFGPGEEELAHTTRESVPLEHLSLARQAYAALASDYLKREFER